MRYALLGWAVVALAISQPAAVRAAGFEDCIRKASELDLRARTAYQTGTYELILREAPQFKELAAINRNLQVTKAWARAARYVWLMRHDAKRIYAGNGLSAFRNFEWNPADEAAFREASADYETQARRIEILAKANNGNKDWPALREYHTDTLFKSPEFRALTKDLNDSDQLVSEIIAVCPAR